MARRATFDSYSLRTAKQNTPQTYYETYGFRAVEEILVSLDYEKTECIIGKRDGRKLKTYKRLFDEWYSFFNIIKPINQNL